MKVISRLFVMPRVALARVAASAVGALLSACGGGTGPSVSSMSASPVGYSRTMTISVFGSALTDAITVAVEPGCVAAAKSAGGTDQSQSFTCKVVTLGEINARVRTNDGVELGRLRLDVPLPQVTLTLATGTATLGRIVAELDPIKAPKSVDNFLAYVNAGFYTSTLFHRVEKDFVVQAGGYTSGLTPKTAGLLPAIELESNNGLKNARGTLAMARQTDPNSATSQFYFNVVDNLSLDFVDDANPGYAVFGRVVSGVDVIDTLNLVAVASKVVKGSAPEVKLDNVPVDEVRISAASQTR